MAPSLAVPVSALPPVAPPKSFQDPVVLIALAVIVSLALFIWRSESSRLALLFLTGAALGVVLYPCHGHPRRAERILSGGMRRDDLPVSVRKRTDRVRSCGHDGDGESRCCLGRSPDGLIGARTEAEQPSCLPKPGCVAY